MLRKIEHVGVAVRGLDEVVPFYRDVLGLAFGGLEEVAGYGVRVAFFGVGESKVELLEPTAESGMIAAFLRTHGPGLHHVAYEVDDIEAAIETCEGHGVEMIDRAPRHGAHGARVAFIRPDQSQSALIELCELASSRGGEAP